MGRMFLAAVVALMVFCLAGIKLHATAPTVVYNSVTGAVEMMPGTAEEIYCYVTVHLDTGQMKYYTQFHYAFVLGGNQTSYVWDSRYGGSGGTAIWNTAISRFIVTGSDTGDTIDFTNVTQSNYQYLVGSSNGAGYYATSVDGAGGSDDITLSPTNQSWGYGGDSLSLSNFDWIQGSSQPDYLFSASANLNEIAGLSGDDVIESEELSVIDGADNSDWIVAYGDDDDITGGNSADYVIVVSGANSFLDMTEPNAATGIHDYTDAWQYIGQDGIFETPDTGYRDSAPTDNFEDIMMNPHGTWVPF